MCHWWDCDANTMISFVSARGRLVLPPEARHALFLRATRCLQSCNIYSY